MFKLGSFEIEHSEIEHRDGFPHVPRSDLHIFGAFRRLQRECNPAQAAWKKVGGAVTPTAASRINLIESLAVVRRSAA